MSKHLVVVESPAKARTISRFLGGNSQVLASMGHVRDLPQRELGVDVQDDFRPSYELTNNGKKVLKALRSAAKDAEAIYLATDPDREGEAIAWHLKQILEESSQAPFYRITFHEITKNAIQNSLLRQASWPSTWLMRSRPGVSWTAWWAIRSARCSGGRWAKAPVPGACSQWPWA